MLNDFMNGLELFRQECNELSDEEFLASFLEMGIEFEDMKESKKNIFDEKQLMNQIYYKVMLQNNSIRQKQLIA